ncbi:MAG: hypothetical protein Q8S56_03625 [Polaromonas sp.]|nr:hypothetical protein [Polaromonas sp.]
MNQIPQETYPVNGHLLSKFSLELLANDATDLVQIETHDGFLVKVLPPEQDFGEGPHEIQELIGIARKAGKEWVHIYHIPAGLRHEYRHHQ